jgi:nucleotide-binding universal stress UspA family protein
VHVWSVFGEAYMEARGGLSGKSIQRLRRDAKQEYARRLDRTLQPIDLDGLITYRHLPRNDDVPWAIVKLAKSKKIDLLVMGTVHRSGLAGFFIGNTAEKVLSEVNCSVLTVKPAGFVTPVPLNDTQGNGNVEHGQQ